MRDSRTRATGLRFPACAQIAGNAYVGALPLSGRLKISQSRSWPRPPRLTHPAKSPPSGNAIAVRCRPVNTRGNWISLAPAAGAGRVEGAAGGCCAAAWVAADAIATCLRNVRRLDPANPHLLDHNLAAVQSKLYQIRAFADRQARPFDPTESLGRIHRRHAH